MYLVRDVFQAKPGKANALMDKFEATIPHIQVEGVKSYRILVDAVAAYWTVVLEAEVENLEAYFSIVQDPKAREGMAGYMELVEGGHREIFKVAHTG